METKSPERCRYRVANSWGECAFSARNPNQAPPSHAAMIDTGFRKDGRVANVSWSQIPVCIGEDHGCNEFTPVDNLKR